MPTPDAPTHYEHSKGIMPPEYDDFFRNIDADWFTSETGNVEAPVGYVALVEVDSDLIEDLKTTRTFDAETPEQGWYVIRLNDMGIIWAMTYGTGTLAEEGARADFDEAEQTYATWEHDSDFI